MGINRKKLIQKHNPIKENFEYCSPLTVGNGSIGFTADVTGMQTLYREQLEAGVPLLTMADWGWHTTPAADGRYYTLEDVAMTEYPFADRIVRYGVEKKPGNEEIYEWVRKNPHRYNLARIGLCYKGKEICAEQINDIRQELDLYTGILSSSFTVEGHAVTIHTMCHGDRDVLGFEIISEECANGNLQVMLALPYGSHEMSGSDWETKEKHTTELLRKSDKELYLLHKLDGDSCHILLRGEACMDFVRCGSHTFMCGGKGETLAFSVAFGENSVGNGVAEEGVASLVDYQSCVCTARRKWQNFWENGGILSFEGSTDKRAEELERRIILSLYLGAINSCTTMPPQETGLTVNSWYGKAHLEMHLWHSAYLPLWGRSDLLKKSLFWYHEIVPRALENAARNGYKGARWPKMVGRSGVDCPSKIAMLLVWQQPHLLYMLELLYQSGEGEAFLREHWELVRLTAEFMADYPVYNEEKKVYELIAPLIPAQERHKPMDTLNPTFEVEYWRFGLQLAIQWAERLGEEVPVKWRQVGQRMAEPSIGEGVYLAHENCPDTYENFAKDHPSMVAALGLLPGERIDRAVMARTLEKIYEVWNFQSMWGWDFAMMAMTETRLGNADRAVDILLTDTEKNQYLLNGNNMQVSRKDLPLYMPGNGSLLLAVALMASQEGNTGFPREGWKVTAEGMKKMPF